MSTGRVRGFTLIELLISTALAMMLAGVVTTAFFKFRNLAARAESRMAMHAAAQRLFTQLHRTMAGIQPTCAFIASTTSGSEVRLVFMRAKEHNWDFMIPTTSSAVNGDLVWEEWVWQRGTSTLKMATNSIGTPSAPGRQFSSGSFAPGSVNYNGKTFYVVPQPRRSVDTTAPLTSTSNGLNDNIYFPDTSVPPVSKASPSGDIGDYTDLENNLVPVSDQMSDLSFEIVSHDGTSTVVDDSATTSPPRVFQGVWLDGRLAPTLDAAPVYAGSDLAKRPRLVRMRFTLTDSKLGVSCPFTFSFLLPDLSARP